MINVHIVSVGTLKESYLREALAEYEKRLAAFCRPEFISIKEKKLDDDPSDAEISAALDDEGERIIKLFSPRSYKIALCIEGKQLSSTELAEKIEKIAEVSSDIYFVIGSSYGLSEKVKSACDMRLSFSKLTFPHQLMRVMLAEAIYRAFGITANTKYHK